MRVLPALSLVCLLMAGRAPAGATGARAHVVALGAVRRVPYGVRSDPDNALPGETTLKVRPLVVDGKVRDWTTGETHDVTDRSFVVRRALRLNDSLPGDRAEHWIWQRGPWIMVDRASGHILPMKLPDYDPTVSQVVWFRDYAAYCGLHAGGHQLYAVVAQVGGRRPLLARRIGPWAPAPAADGAPPARACGPATWQRDPLRVGFAPSGAAPMSFSLVGLSAVLVEDGDADDGAAAAGPTSN